MNKAEACLGILTNPMQMKVDSIGKNESTENWQTGGFPRHFMVQNGTVYSPILAGKGTSCTAGSRLIT